MRVAAALVAALVASTHASAASLFVDQTNGSDASDGLTWATARATVGSALATAVGTPEPDVISVATGRYVEMLVVPPDASLLGGFPPGGGTRDPSVNPTVLDGAGGGSVVHFPPGSDGGGLEGFTVTGGAGTEGPDFVSYGGGILVEDAAPLIRDNVIEDNHACHGGGVALVYSSPRLAALLQGNVLRRNGFPSARPECSRGNWASGSGVYVSGPPGADLGLVLDGNRISASLWGYGALVFIGSGSLQHDIIEDSRSSGLALSGGPLRVSDELVVRSIGDGISLDCAGDYRLENVTVADNATAITAGGVAAPTSATVENSILWRNTSQVTWACGGAPVVLSSVVEGGFVGGTSIIDADPLFVPGPQHAYYLSQVPSGQPTTSPAVDAGSQSAVAASLDQRTTATNSTLDAAAVDLGFHAVPATSLTVLRGTVATGLVPHRTVTALPFVDDPGTLSNPALPLLYYEVRLTDTDIAVTKDTVADAVMLSFR